MAAPWSKYVLTRSPLRRRAHPAGDPGAPRAGAARRRPPGAHGGPPRAAGAARAEQGADRVSRPVQPHRRAPRSRSPTRAAGRFTGSDIPARPAAAVDSGHGSRRQAGRADRQQHPQRRLRAALGRRRLDVRRRGRARPALDDVARQPAQPQAGDPPRSGVPRARPKRRRRDERLGAGRSSAARSIDDWSKQLVVHDEDLPRPRPAPRRPARAARRRRRLLGLDRRPGRLRGEQPARGCAPTASSLVLYLPKIQTAEEAALWNDMHHAARGASRPRGRHGEDLRARRAARGGVPVDGDPRRARARASSASTPAAGTTSTACRTRWRGIRRSSTPTSTRSR